MAAVLNDADPSVGLNRTMAPHDLAGHPCAFGGNALLRKARGLSDGRHLRPFALATCGRRWYTGRADASRHREPRRRQTRLLREVERRGEVGGRSITG